MTIQTLPLKKTALFIVIFLIRVLMSMEKASLIMSVFMNGAVFKSSLSSFLNMICPQIGSWQ